MTPCPFCDAPVDYIDDENGECSSCRRCFFCGDECGGSCDARLDDRQARDLRERQIREERGFA